jgi:hypothetical protein
LPPLSTTIVNEPVERCPKFSSRITSARCVSVSGSTNRIGEQVREPERRDHRQDEDDAPGGEYGGAVAENEPRQPFHLGAVSAVTVSQAPRPARGLLALPDAGNGTNCGYPHVHDEPHECRGEG